MKVVAFLITFFLSFQVFANVSDERIHCDDAKMCASAEHGFKLSRMIESSSESEEETDTSGDNCDDKLVLEWIRTGVHEVQKNQNYKKAQELFQKACECKSTGGCFNLGIVVCIRGFLEK